jgi:hypothetical protein
MTIKRTEDLKAYMLQKYSFLHPKKFEIIKVGTRVYMYYVANDGSLSRQVVFKGCLPTTEGVPKLREHLEKSVDEAVKKWNPQNVNN